MTSKERFLAAIRNEIPDRVPATPDISNMVPAKRTGLPFWDVYFHKKTPLWRAYLDACVHYGMDAWIASGWDFGAELVQDTSGLKFEVAYEYLEEHDAVVKKTRVETPDGPLTREDLCFRADPPSPTVKWIKDFERDFPRLRWLIRPPVGFNADYWNTMRAACEEHQFAFGPCIGYPGFQVWVDAMEGGLEALTYAHEDYPEMFDEWAALGMEYGRKTLEIILPHRPDYVLLGGSGTLTMASPELVRKYALPSLKLFSRMCREAGVPTLLHSCGKSRLLIDMLAEETDVNCVNPLEIPPMGDVILAEAKKARGHQIALMGNLHTTDVMLRGTPELVRETAIQALRDGAENGGFILSTGDQCGRDTPEENLFALVQVAKEFGVYDRATGKLPKLG